MNVEKLLQPEKLSDDELIRILASLNIDVSISNPRSYLLDVYNRVALPLPQRPKSSKNGNAKLTNSTETNSTGQLDLLKSVKQEQIPIAHIVDNTKKMKLDNSYPHFSYPEAMDECSAEISQMNLRRGNLKRKQFMDFTDCIKRIRNEEKLETKSQKLENVMILEKFEKSEETKIDQGGKWKRKLDDFQLPISF